MNKIFSLVRSKLELFGLSAIVLFYGLTEYFLFQYHDFPLTRGETDGIEYMVWSGGPLFQVNPFHGPGYPVAIRVISSLGKFDPFFSAKLVSVLSGFIFILIAYAFFLLIKCNKYEALLGVFLLSVNPVFLSQSNLILSDMFGVLCFYGSFSLILADEKRVNPKYLIAGLLGGVAYLTRYIYVIVIIIPLIWLLFFVEKKNFKMVVIKYLEFLAGFLLVSLPWLIFLYHEKGSPFWNLNYLNVAYYMFHFGSGWNLFPSEDQYSSLFSVFMHDRSVFVITWIKSLLGFLPSASKLLPVIGVFFFWGAFNWLSDMKRPRAMVLICIIPLILITCLIWVEARFLLFFLPFVSVMAANGLLALPSKATVEYIWGSEVKSFQIPLRVSVVFGVIIIAFTQVPKAWDEFVDQANEYQAAIKWLKKEGISETKILESKPHIAFFSNSSDVSFRSLGMQFSTSADLPTLLKGAKPDLLIYDQRYGAEEFPQFSDLLDPQNNKYADILKPIYVVNDPMRLIIYKYKNQSK